jgi:hypothetical protein
VRLLLEGPVAHVALCRRNLLALLHKLDMPGSARTLYADMPDGSRLVVTCEDDAEHYAGRVPPGPLHPVTEAFVHARDDAGPGGIAGGVLDGTYDSGQGV